MSLTPTAIIASNGEYWIARSDERTVEVRDQRGNVLFSASADPGWAFGEFVFVGRWLVGAKTQGALNAGFVVWDWAAGVKTLEYSGTSDGRQLISSPSSSSILARTTEGIARWNLDSQECVWRRPLEATGIAVLSEEPGLLAFTTFGKLWVESARGHVREFSIRGDLDELSWGLGYSVLFGCQFGRYGDTTVWDLRDGSVRCGIPVTGAILATSPNRRHLVLQTGIVDLVDLSVRRQPTSVAAFDHEHGEFVLLADDAVRRLAVRD